MERDHLMRAVESRALAYRIDLSTLCKRAGVSRTVAVRWKAGHNTPRLETIGKLERALTRIEQERREMAEAMADAVVWSAGMKL